MAPQKPLRTAIIGLSASASSSWAAVAHLPNILSPTGQTLFTLTALLNSSPTASKAAIQKFSLPQDTTHPISSPAHLAADPTISLVITNTRVDNHHATTLASIRAGKDAYIEWPIASTPDHIDDLVRAARESGARVAIGLQARWAPPVRALRDVVESERFGKWTSSRFVAYSNGTEVSEGLKYFTERKVGGNFVTILGGHSVDMVQSVIGDFAPDADAHLSNLYPTVTVRNNDGSTSTIQKDVPDIFVVQGHVSNAPHAAPNAISTFQLLQPSPFPGTPKLEWVISFERGEVRLVSQDSLALGTGTPYVEGATQPTIQTHDFETGEVGKVPWEWSAEEKEVGVRARSVGRSLRAFARGEKEGDGWVGIEEAAGRARQVEGWLVKAGF
ncbi:putative oxidoreductase [Aaosphaeria arxii CBS 175.79]|uniref:Putative oxidoreductase n=1 Tax=Aaosphaeria arxii CBS 175.79 TaxID=1450172 RepID=A0A6A5Y6A0_9PLEO|nr:putative oxidoreductase [Aaosphaeria arxii CBS 175.79]KAF2020733.1 putative oxidoreductase [Aaosphaeria arxii CBS 175.79]